METATPLFLPGVGEGPCEVGRAEAEGPLTLTHSRPSASLGSASLGAGLPPHVA